MRSFRAFVVKEFRHIFRDRRTMLILLAMPVVQILLFGFAISTEVNDSRLMVLTPTEDATVKRVVERLAGNRYFSLVGMLHSPAEMDEAFRRGEADVVVVFPQEFEKKLLYERDAALQVAVDATDPNTASLMAAYVQGILASAFPSGGQRGIGVETHLLFNPQMESAYNFVPGVMGLILMLICAMMTSVSIVREKERGTMEVLLASPVRPLGIIVAKAVPYFVLSCVNLASILLLAVYVLHVPVAGSVGLLSVLSLIFIALALSLGLLISTLVKTQVAAMLISGMVLMMPTMLLSGMIFPIESMPAVLQWIAQVVPARWYIAAVSKLMIEVVGLFGVWKETSVMAGMALLLMTVSLWKFKKRLE